MNFFIHDKQKLDDLIKAKLPLAVPFFLDAKGTSADTLSKVCSLSFANENFSFITLLMFSKIK